VTNKPDRAKATVGGFVWATVFRLLRSVFGGSRRSGHYVVGTGLKVVACLGSSSTDATGSYDWIKELALRPRNVGLRFVRFAEGGDLAYNGLQRVPDIVSQLPDYVVILLGGNDLMAIASAKHAQFARMTKHLPEPPSPQWYRENMRSIVRQLKAGTDARIGLCSLPPVGEQPESSDIFQSEINRLSSEFNAAISDIANDEAVSYLPVHERIEELIRAHPGPALTGFKVLPLYRDALRQFVFHKSNDEIGQLNGWHYHRDGIHLNSAAGEVLADCVQSFLDTHDMSTQGNRP
jgi:lysophospholipase L1-like esterase